MVPLTPLTQRALLLRAAHAGLAAAHPVVLLRNSALIAGLCKVPPKGRTLVLGIGKAAGAMARALAELWPDPETLTGLVVAREPQVAPPFAVIVGDHPNPGAGSAAAAAAVDALCAGLGRDDLVIALVSGGGSALLFDPLPGRLLGGHAGLPLADCNAVLAALMAAGAAIADLNTVRRHLSRHAGGRLAVRCAPAQVALLVLSDVPGDDPALVASGPFSPDPSRLADVREVLDRFGIVPSKVLAAALDDPAFETPKPGDAAFARVRSEGIAAAVWMPAVRAELLAAGYAVQSLGDHLDGDARAMARNHAHAALAAARQGKRVALISGGEATTQLRGPGSGGANSEFALAFALELGAPESSTTKPGQAAIAALAIDTDGIDGSAAAAGALVLPDTLARAATLGLDPEAFLARSDSGGFFAALEDAVVTGPTQTNVNDCRIILIGNPRA